MTDIAPYLVFIVLSKASLKSLSSTFHGYCSVELQFPSIFMNYFQTKINLRILLSPTMKLQSNARPPEQHWVGTEKSIYRFSFHSQPCADHHKKGDSLLCFPFPFSFERYAITEPTCERILKPVSALSLLCLFWFLRSRSHGDHLLLAFRSHVAYYCCLIFFAESLKRNDGCQR